MSHISYMTRRSCGTYQFQIRLGQALAGSWGTSHLRVSLRTHVPAIARRRMSDLLNWAVKFKEAPDLEQAGQVMLSAMRVELMIGIAFDEDRHEKRLLIERTMRHFIDRCREAQYVWTGKGSDLAGTFKSFVEMNIAEASAIKKRLQRSSYEGGRADALEAAREGWLTQQESQDSTFQTTTEKTDPSRALDGRIAELLNGVEKLVARERYIEATTETSEALLMSETVDLFLAAEEHRTGSRKVEGTLRPVLHFAIKLLIDPKMDLIDSAAIKKLDEALSHIPSNKGFSTSQRSDLFGKYQRAQDHGWEGLQRISLTTLRLKYRKPLMRFFQWAIDEKHYVGRLPGFTACADEITAPLPRDKFSDSDLIKIVSLPLFTGCESKWRVWTQGKYFIQNDLYWVYLILFFTGMRTGEPPQLKLDDITEVDGIYFFDLRPYDPSKGRVSLAALKQLKRARMDRVIPIHPLLIGLGLLARRDALRVLGHDRLFPDWKPGISKIGEVRWGAALSKSFRIVREKADITASNISVYSSRHLLADWLDSETTPQRTRNRILGHENKQNSADTYGGKSTMTADQSRYLTEINNPVVKEMADILLRAKAAADEGRLTRIQIQALIGRKNSSVS